ncbi:casein kinase I isoform delta [Trichophyton mentagrophytes]|nr:casein kinase I isoform delta [Trichophyton mentagrophytes]
MALPLQTIDGRYKLIREFGGGAFLGKRQIQDDGELLSAAYREVVVKLESYDTEAPSLEREANNLESLAGYIGVPLIQGRGTQGRYRFMVICVPGPSLDSLLGYCKGKFSLKTVLLLGEQLIHRIELLHSQGLIHGGIRPSAFGLGVEKAGGQVTLVEVAALTPTTELTQRYSDLKALVLMYILRQMENTQAEVLCWGLPRAFKDCLEHVKSSNQNHKPDYNHLRELLRTAFSEKGFSRDGVFDWTVYKHLNNLQQPYQPVTGITDEVGNMRLSVELFENELKVLAEEFSEAEEALLITIAVMTSFQVYCIPDRESALRKIFEANTFLHQIQGAHTLRGSHCWFIASYTPPRIPYAVLIHNDTSLDKQQINQEDFVIAAADAANSKNIHAWLAYKRIAEQNNLVSKIEYWRYSQLKASRKFYISRQHSLLNLEGKINKIFNCLFNKTLEAAIKEVRNLSVSLVEMRKEGETQLDEEYRILRQGVNFIQEKVASCEGRVGSILYLFTTAKKTRAEGVHVLLVAHQHLTQVVDYIRSLRSFIGGEIQRLEQPLQDLDLPKISRPHIHQLYFLCAVLLFSCVENPVFEDRQQQLEDILSWEKEDWAIEFKFIENSTEYYLAMHNHLQNVPYFKDNGLPEGIVEKQYKCLATNIQSISANAPIQPAGLKDERFSAIQNLLIICAGIGWFAALPTVTGYLRLMIKPDTFLTIQRSPLYKYVDTEVIGDHVDKLILLLEPPKERERLNKDLGDGRQACGTKRLSPCPAGDERPAKK